MLLGSTGVLRVACATAPPLPEVPVDFIYESRFPVSLESRVRQVVNAVRRVVVMACHTRP